jgi:hypothetical protein
LDLEYFLLRFFNHVLHQEVPKLFSQQELRGLVDKTTAQQPKVQQFETDRRQGLGFIKFSVNISRPHNSSEVPKLKLFSEQEFRGLENTTTAQQPKVQQFGFQDPQAAAVAATSGS